MDRDFAAPRLPLCRAGGGNARSARRGDRADAGACIARQAVRRGASIREFERRPRAGIFRRRHGRRHHRGTVAHQVAVRHRAQFELHLQRHGRRREAGRVASSACATCCREACARTAGRVRITAQMIEAETGGHVWTERFDRALDDVFALQDEIALIVVGAIEPSLREAEVERVKRKRPDSLDAYDLVLQAQPDVYSGMPEQVTKALVLLERALALDPDLCAGARLCGDVPSLPLPARRAARRKPGGLDPPCSGRHHAWPGRRARSDFRRILHRHGWARPCCRVHRVRRGACDQPLIGPHVYLRQRHARMGRRSRARDRVGRAGVAFEPFRSVGLRRLSTH